SGDGRAVAFASDATNLVARDTNRSSDVFVRNRALATTVRISLTSGGTQARHTLDGSGAPVISENGRFVAFQSAASNLVARDTNRTTDVFVRDRRTRTTQRVSVGSTGRQARRSTLGSELPAISADGRFIAFVSDAWNLVGRDSNRAADVFVRDRR